jgi:hypothetical protein
MATKKVSSTKGSSKKGSGKKRAGRSGPRELIDTGTDRRYVRRGEGGRFDEVVDVGRSLAQDRKRHARTTAKPGYGDQGDQAPRESAKKSGAKKSSAKKR